MHYLHKLLGLQVSQPKTNFQTFVNTVLCNVNSKFNILGYSEIRLRSQLVSLYQFPGYKIFIGVALYISDCYHSIAPIEFSKVDTYIECIGVQTTIMNKKLLLVCIYRSPSGNINKFINAFTELLSLAHDKKI